MEHWQAMGPTAFSMLLPIFFFSEKFFFFLIVSEKKDSELYCLPLTDDDRAYILSDLQKAV